MVAAVSALPLDPLSVLLLAAGALLVVVPSLVVGYLLGGALLEVFTP